MKVLIVLLMLCSVAFADNGPGVCTNDDEQCCSAHPNDPNCPGGATWDQYQETIRFQEYLDSSDYVVLGYPTCSPTGSQPPRCQVTIRKPIVFTPAELVCTYIQTCQYASPCEWRVSECHIE